MRNLSILVAAFCAITAAQAQVQSGSSAGATATTAPVTITTNESSSDRLKTTGSVFLPGNAVSSGGFNCSATMSAGVGVLGGVLGGSTSFEMQDCVRLNLLNFAVQAKDNAMYEAIWCGIAAGRAAVIEAGLTCPADRRADRQTARASAQPGYTIDPR